MSTLLSTPFVIALLVSTVLPLVSSLVTTVKMPPEAAGLVTLALSTITGFLTEWAHAGVDFDWRAAAVTAALSWLTAAVARARVWIGSRTDSKLLAVGNRVVATVDEATGGGLSDSISGGASTA